MKHSFEFYENKIRKLNSFIMQNHWLFKTYMRLPLWGKIAAPLVSVLLVMALFKMMKAAIGLAILGGVAYVAISAYNKYNAGKDA